MSTVRRALTEAKARSHRDTEPHGLDLCLPVHIAPGFPLHASAVLGAQFSPRRRSSAPANSPASSRHSGPEALSICDFCTALASITAAISVAVANRSRFHRPPWCSVRRQLHDSSSYPVHLVGRRPDCWPGSSPLLSLGSTAAPLWCFLPSVFPRFAAIILRCGWCSVYFSCCCCRPRPWLWAVLSVLSRCCRDAWLLCSGLWAARIVTCCVAGLHYLLSVLQMYYHCPSPTAACACCGSPRRRDASRGLRYT